jgi:hypothetical protein
MNVLALLHGIGSIGLFSSRIFLPALMTSLLLRFGPEIPIIHHLGLLQHLHHNEPTWFTSDATIIILAILSVLEIIGQKNPEIRNLLHEFDIYGKTALAALTSLGVISASDSSFVRTVTHQASFLDGIIPLIVAIGTFRVSRARKTVAVTLFEHLEGTHLDRLINWAEEAWVIFGAWLLVLFPIFALLVIGLATFSLYMFRRHLRKVEEHARIACSRCGKPVYPCAMACPGCREPVKSPVEIGFLGQSKTYPTDDLEHHPYRLAEKRRCPVCAAHLPSRRPLQACATCGDAAMADPKFVQEYLHYVDHRFPLVLGVCFVLSLVPVLGLIVGAIYYRSALVLPFSQYLPMGRSFLLRWILRLLFLVLILLQVIPLLGGLVVPLMAFQNYTVYRDSFHNIVLSKQPELHLVRE